MYQYQALTHKRRAMRQQDAVLIGGKIIQNKGLISTVYESQSFCIGVSDGVATSPNSHITSKAVLKSLKNQFDKNAVDFYQIQNDITELLVDKPQYEGASATLVCAYHKNDKINIKSLGDSRAYLYCKNKKSWQLLTKDHSFINELKSDKDFDENKEYASIYDALTGYFCIDSFHELEKEYHCTIDLNDDVLLLCSDGLHDELPTDKWLSVENMSLKEWLIAMYELLKTNCSYDNVSMILLKSVDGLKIH